jgi:lupus La protein
MDKFLLSQTGGTENLPVDLKIIHSFKRMRHFQPFSAIVAALKDSKILELTEDDTKVRRKVALSDTVDPEKMDPDSIKVFEDRAMPRSIYAKGFGEEDANTQLDIEKFFEPHGPFNAVRLQRQRLCRVRLGRDTEEIP